MLRGENLQQLKDWAWGTKRGRKTASDINKLVHLLWSQDGTYEDQTTCLKHVNMSYYTWSKECELYVVLQVLLVIEWEDHFIITASHNEQQGWEKARRGLANNTSTKSWTDQRRGFLKMYLVPRCTTLNAEIGTIY